MKVHPVIAFAIFLGAVGCGDSGLRFVEPQPNRSKVLNEFPHPYQSFYTPTSDSSVVGFFDFEYKLEPDSAMEVNADNSIEITNRAIFNYLKGTLVIDFKLIDDSAVKALYPNPSIVDTLAHAYYKRPKCEYELISNQDSIMKFKFYLVDTMFYISKSNVLVKHKKNLYINILNEENSWALYQIVLSGTKKLTLNSLSNDDAKMFRRILEDQGEDFESEIIQPSKNAFNKFLKIRGFNRTIELTKISPELN